MTASSCGHGPGLHLSDDLTIVEPVDRQGRPVAPGERAAKIYATVLYNHTLPLIRYQISDEITLLDEACPCGSAHRLISDPLGRLDDALYHDVLMVHPHMFRSALARRREVIEYQVGQTTTGAHVVVRCQGLVDLEGLRDEIRDGLARLGLPRPVVSVRAAAHIERQVAGKLMRLVPLENPPCSGPWRSVRIRGGADHDLRGRAGHRRSPSATSGRAAGGYGAASRPATGG